MTLDTPRVLFNSINPMPTTRKRRTQVKLACLNCRRQHAACTESRPCERCTRLGLTSCEDVPRRKRSKKETQVDSVFNHELRSLETHKTYTSPRLSSIMMSNPNPSLNSSSSIQTPSYMLSVDHVSGMRSHDLPNQHILPPDHTRVAATLQMAHSTPTIAQYPNPSSNHHYSTTARMHPYSIPNFESLSSPYFDPTSLVSNHHAMASITPIVDQYYPPVPSSSPSPSHSIHHSYPHCVNTHHGRHQINAPHSHQVNALASTATLRHHYQHRHYLPADLAMHNCPNNYLFQPSPSSQHPSSLKYHSPINNNDGTESCNSTDNKKDNSTLHLHHYLDSNHETILSNPPHYSAYFYLPSNPSSSTTRDYTTSPHHVSKDPIHLQLLTTSASGTLRVRLSGQLQLYHYPHLFILFIIPLIGNILSASNRKVQQVISPKYRQPNSIVSCRSQS